jgi:hypothetical protein
MSKTSQDTRQRVGPTVRGHESTADFKARLAAIARGHQAPDESIKGAHHAPRCVVRTKRDARTPAEVMAFGKKKKAAGARHSRASKGLSYTRTRQLSN